MAKKFTVEYYGARVDPLSADQEKFTVAMKYFNFFAESVPIVCWQYGVVPLETTHMNAGKFTDGWILSGLPHIIGCYGRKIKSYQNEDYFFFVF